MPKEERTVDEEQKRVFCVLMYALTKDAARNSFINFLDNWGIKNEEYEQVKMYLKENYGIKTYV
jgi:hypothetical protein